MLGRKSRTSHHHLSFFADVVNTMHRSTNVIESIVAKYACADLKQVERATLQPGWTTTGLFSLNQAVQDESKGRSGSLQTVSAPTMNQDRSARSSEVSLTLRRAAVPFFVVRDFFFRFLLPWP